MRSRRVTTKPGAAPSPSRHAESAAKRAPDPSGALSFLVAPTAAVVIEAFLLHALLQPVDATLQIAALPAVDPVAAVALSQPFHIAQLETQPLRFAAGQRAALKTAIDAEIDA